MTEPSPPAAPPPDEPGLWQVLVLLAPLAALVIALVYLGAKGGPPRVDAPTDVPASGVVAAMIRWDSGWYGAIAEQGYWRYAPDDQGPVASFPLYPLAMRALAATGLNRWTAGFLVTLLSGLAALLLFLRWAYRARPEGAAIAFWLFALWPFAVFFFGPVYPDALFVALSLAAFLSVEQRQPTRAMVFGALATACKPIGLAVAIGLTLRSLELRRREQAAVRGVDVVPALSALGWLAYLVFLQVRFGDALGFLKVLGASGWDEPVAPATWFKLAWFRELAEGSTQVVARLGAHAVAAALAIAGVVATFKRLGRAYGVFCALVVGLSVLGSKDFQGVGRAVLGAFPLFLTLALVLGERPRWRAPWLVASGLGLLLVAFALGRGVWVA